PRGVRSRSPSCRGRRSRRPRGGAVSSATPRPARRGHEAGAARSCSPPGVRQHLFRVACDSDRRLLTERRSMLRVLASAVILTVSPAGLTACGDDDSGGSGGNTIPVTIQVAFDGDTVTPNGDRVKVEVGQPVELDVTADKPGEIHVHSDPE